MQLITGQSSKAKIRELIKTILIFWLGTFVCKIFLRITESYILPYYHVESPNIELKESFIQLQNELGSFWPFFFILIAPLVEETSVRLALSFKKRDVFIGLYTLFFVCVNAATGNLHNFPLWKILILLLALAGCLYLYKKIRQEPLTQIKNKYGKSIIYLSIMLFVLLHIPNFDSFTLAQNPFFICYFSYLLITSYCITRLRIYNGFWWGYGLHVINNALATWSSFG